jgi:hypothetical protein
VKADAGIIRLLASDLSNHLACHHLISLNLAVAIGARPAPAWHFPDAYILIRSATSVSSEDLKDARLFVKSDDLPPSVRRPPFL